MTVRSDDDACARQVWQTPILESIDLDRTASGPQPSSGDNPLVSPLLGPPS